MRLCVLVFGLLSGVFGVCTAKPLFDTQGFEPPLYVPGTVVLQSQPGMVWVQWDAAGNNANREHVLIQSDVVHSGKQALALADTGERVIARAHGLNLTEDLFYIDGWYKTESFTDPGLARLTLRFRQDGASKSKLFNINTQNGAGSLFDHDDPNKTGSFLWGDWNRVTIEINLADNEYTMWIGGFEWFSGTLCKEGSPEELVSWELDVEASDPSREPKGDLAFYVDELSIETVNPLPDGK